MSCKETRRLRTSNPVRVTTIIDQFRWDEVSEGTLCLPLTSGSNLLPEDLGRFSDPVRCCKPQTHLA